MRIQLKYITRLEVFKIKKILELYLVFLKLGTVCFGGGYAMLPLLQREIVEKRKYATEEEIIDYYAIGQMTPGAIAINVSTFVGYKIAGIPGGIFATLGIITSPIIIITIIASLISNFAEIYYVKCALAGIRAAVLALILKTIITMSKKSVIDAVTLIILIASFIVMLLGVSAVFVVLGSLLTGIIYKGFRKNA